MTVNRERCQGHARCFALAPELFELDEWGNAH
jgi:ferredoxin